MHFEDLNLHPALLSTVCAQGYHEPTPIQARAIPEVLAGRDVLGCARTGTGKTAAFALPILHSLAGRSRVGTAPRALVLVPTRELAVQVGEVFSEFGRKLGLRCAVVYGGIGQARQVAALRAGVDVLVAAPGRLLDLMQQRLVLLNAVEHFVLDEADRMLDMGFIQPIRRVVAALPKKRQTLLFSATMPASIRSLAEGLLCKPVFIAVSPVSSTADGVEQHVYFVDRARKPELLAHVLSQPAVERVIVFTRTKHGADKVAQKLRQSRILAEVIHGNKSQNARQRALVRFKEGDVRVLVATDIAARGIDVSGISHVVNFDVPEDPDNYVHRVGRTARAGASGLALSFCSHEERHLLRDIERVTKKPMIIEREHPFRQGVKPASVVPAAENQERGCSGSTPRPQDVPHRRDRPACTHKPAASSRGRAPKAGWHAPSQGRSRPARVARAR